MRPSCVPILFALVLPACAGDVLEGEVGGDGFAIVESVFFELRGRDQGTSLPFHDITVWMMPIADSCARYPQLVDDLAAVRLQLDDGQDPNDYCDDWAAVWQEFNGNEPFWLVQLRLQAQPRGDDETPLTTYPYLDSDGAVAPDAPWFDASLARHTIPDLQTCADVFAGADWFPTVTEVAGGEVEVKRYVEDGSVRGTVGLDIADQDPVGGTFDAAFCPSAGGWPLELSFSL